MGKIKIHEIAKKIGVNSKEVLEKALELGLDVKTHMSSVDESDAKKIEAKFSNANTKKEVKENDLSINNMNENDICKLYSKKSCNDFSSLNYSSVGKKDFYQETMHIIEEVKNRTYDKNVYIVDVINDLNRQNIRGYVLVNNIDGNKEMYLYLTNDLFMISGYNLTKLGNFDENSTTIRAYNESAFNLSSKDMRTVCLFSGFNQCFNLQNELV